MQYCATDILFKLGPGNFSPAQSRFGCGRLFLRPSFQPRNFFRLVKIAIKAPQMLKGLLASALDLSRKRPAGPDAGWPGRRHQGKSFLWKTLWSWQISWQASLTCPVTPGRQVLYSGHVGGYCKGDIVVRISHGKDIF